MIDSCSNENYPHNNFEIDVAASEKIEFEEFTVTIFGLDSTQYYTLSSYANNDTIYCNKIFCNECKGSKIKTKWINYFRSNVIKNILNDTIIETGGIENNGFVGFLVKKNGATLDKTYFGLNSHSDVYNKFGFLKEIIKDEPLFDAFLKN